MKRAHSIGIIVSARIQEQRSVSVVTVNRLLQYSPTMDSARKIGRKAADVVSEDESRGVRSSLAESTAASTRPFPDAIWTIIDSDITIALSTSIPRAMIREASDIWCRLMPNADMKMKVINMAMGISVAIRKPVLSPRATSITTSTIPML